MDNMDRAVIRTMFSELLSTLHLIMSMEALIAQKMEACKASPHIMTEEEIALKFTEQTIRLTMFLPMLNHWCGIPVETENPVMQ